MKPLTLSMLGNAVSQVKPRVGFLGLGWIGHRRLEALVESGTVEVAAFSDPLAANVEACAALSRGLVTRSFDEMLALDLDGVVIATPSALHAEQTIAALESGCSVFCQKPLGRNAAEVRRIIECAKAADRLLGVDLSYRHTAGLREIRELIRGGKLGDIFAADLVFHNAYGPQAPWFYDRQLSGGGCVIDLGIHLVDAALWVLDQPVVGVSSRIFAGGRPLSARPDAVEDFATARLDLANGTVIQLACSWRLHAGREAVIEVAFHGTQGGAAMRNVGGSFVDFRAERFSGTNSEVIAEPPDEWGGQAAVAWARQLAVSRGYDPEVERQIEIAVALDAIYAGNSGTSTAP
ncbi:MAG: Gfo/Idh/MocA family oxidoreductase [Chthoniobacteraceae bacterium]